MSTRFLCVTGPLGSGKTTTLLRLRPPHGTQLVVNEIGELQIDVDRLSRQFGSEVDLASLVAGCLGCDNAAGFEAIVAETVAIKRELLIVEPTGVADAREIKAIIDQYDLPWACLTLVNPVTFDLNVVEGLLAAQLSVATAVGITRADQMTETQEAEILAYIAMHAPGVPVYMIAATGDLGFELDGLLGVTRTFESTSHHHHVHDENCDHEHGLHGYVSVALQLQPEVTLEGLLAAVAPMRSELARAKGIIGGYWFDIVGPEVSRGVAVAGDPYVVLIASSPINSWLLAGIQAERPALPGKKQLMTGGAHDLDKVIAAIKHHATSYPHPRTADGFPILGPDNDVAVYLSRTPGVPEEYQALALQARMWFMLQAVEVMAEAEHAGLYVQSPGRLASDLLEAGAALAWNAHHKADLLDGELIAQIIGVEPARMALRGLGSLESLNLHLLPDDNQGPTTPGAIRSIVNFGFRWERLSLGEAVAAMRHALQMAHGYPVWEQRWRAAIAELVS